MGRIQAGMKAIFEYRKETQGLTQKRLSELVGATPAMVSSLLNGDRRINEDWIEKFCDVLGVTLGDIERPSDWALEPRLLREGIDKLRRLYRVQNSPAFECALDVIDHWLRSFESQTGEQIPDAGAGSVDGKSPVLPEAQRPPEIDYRDPKHEHDAPREEIYSELPFFDQFRVPAGKPNEAPADGVMSTCKVLRHLAKEDRFVIRVTGDSMEPRILDRDLILVDCRKEPRPGNIVVAMINGAAVVKKFLRPKGQIILRSTNPRYAEIEVKENDQFQITGVVLRIVEGQV
jgi:DNA polymerase V